MIYMTRCKTVKLKWKHLLPQLAYIGKVVAVGMGAEIIEKHITIDRCMKGTDQAGQ